MGSTRDKRCRMALKVAPVLAIVVLFWASATMQGQPQPKYTFPIDTSWLSPLFIDVRVNGSDPMRFILDSASTWSMIRRAEAEKLGLKIVQSETATGAG